MEAEFGERTNLIKPNSVLLESDNIFGKPLLLELVQHKHLAGKSTNVDGLQSKKNQN